MTIKDKVKGRAIGVLGMARSGMAAALLAKKHGGEVFVSDAADRERLLEQVKRLEATGIPFETGGHSDQLLKCDYVIISPGIPLTADIVKRILGQHIPVFSELEFASWFCKGTIVAVTGSNGKSTTTTLIGEVFKAAGYETFVCGNIGYPFAEVAALIPEDGVAVVEVSTFQLETIELFKPHVALILNLTPDHLDRHGSFDAYKRMKYRITENQTQDGFFITNADDPELAAADIATSARRLRFSVGPEDGAETFVKDDHLCARIEDQTIKILRCADMGISGEHNLQNAAAAVVAATALGLELEVVAGVLKSFPGVEHRLEKVCRVAGIQFVNDSKATNVDSVVVALKAVAGPVHLILGGRDKGSPYEPIAEVGRSHVKTIVAIGEAKEKIFDALGKSFPVQFADTMEDAVQQGFGLARPGETVLLSPACSSFDMFDDFEHRGRVFKEAVMELTKGKKENGTVSSH